MTWLGFMDRIIIPTVILVLLAGGIGGLLLGCALALKADAALRFMARMNSWISTDQALHLLDVPYRVESAPGPGGRRPLLGSFFLVGGVIALAVLVWRMQFPMLRSLGLQLVLEALKWFLVLGSAFAMLIGALLLFAPARFAAIEDRMNRWYAPQLPPAEERLHTPLEPRVASAPRTAGLAIAGASLAVIIVMGAALVARML